MQTNIIVRTQFEGFHKWKEAPFEVKFLRSLHRHIFYIECSIEVYHFDRELEFFLVKQYIDDLIKIELPRRCTAVEEWSCEMYAKFILRQLTEQYGVSRDMIIRVFEDYENGAEIIYIKGDIIDD